MRRTALHTLALLAVATVSFGAWAQGIDAPPEDETAPSRNRERPDDPETSSADAGTDAAPPATPSASAPAAASSAPAPQLMKLPPPVASATPDESDPDREHEPSELGFSFGIRGSYATPFGAANGGPLNGVMLGLFPVGLDLGWFFSPNLYVGAYGLYGFAVGVEPTSDTCSDPDEACSATFIRFGITAEWHFRPHRFYDPWVGVGFGYEIINLTAGNDSTEEQDESEPLHGFELLNLRAGLDFKPKNYYGMGPFVELSTGHYVTDGGNALALHEWLGFGLRLHSGI